MSAIYVTVEGVVDTEVREATWNGMQVASFRFVASERRFDNRAQTWVESHASWLSVSCYRLLATHVAASVHKGDRLIVRGKLRVKEYLGHDGQSRISADLEATSIGHDLRYGTSRFEPARAQNADDGLREQAEQLMRELAQEPYATVDDLVAERVGPPPSEPHNDRSDEEPDEFDDGFDASGLERGDARRRGSRLAAASASAPD